jgi:hypothetical protein
MLNRPSRPGACLGLVVKSANAACQLIPYCTLMFLLLEKFLPVLSQALTIKKCDPFAMGTSAVILVDSNLLRHLANRLRQGSTKQFNIRTS